ncbi:iron reductase [Mycena maculata]|uniref:ferric-chelate reductase (NADPH) n=1 Tax=Mycena maculata TaxID=230809 RepID=A0AAD7MY95_9AGAR|nr:iron reductase [Mycena maculata]
MEPSVQSLKGVDPDRIARTARASLYPKQVWYFLATFLALISACHLVSVLHLRWTRRNAPQSTDAPLRHGVSWRPGVYTLNVADFLLAAMYIGVLFTWTFINTTNTLGRKYDPKYWANRCGHIAGSQLPLMAALGMKNNFISFLTGVGFDKLQRLHRTAARVICVMLWVHGFGRVSTASWPPSSSLSGDQTQSWFKSGVMGASALTLLCFLSVRPLRSRNYEAFRYIHLVFALLTLVGSYVHASNSGNGSYVWPALFLWGLDRALRFARIVLLNSQLFQRSDRTVASDATVSVLSPHFLRILVDTPPYFRWRAGQCAYITIPGAYPTSATETHPFTIANAPHEADLTMSDEASLSGEPPKDTDPGAASEKASSEGGYASEGARHPRLMFILRVREGFTKRLLESALARSDGNGVNQHFKALVDGPYGSPPTVKGFQTVVFICGGSGVSFVLPLFLDLVQAARAKTNPRCTRVVFVWAIRDPNQITWIADALLGIHPAEAALGIDIDIRLHVTAAPEDTQSFESDRSSILTDPELASGTDLGTEKVDSTPKQRLLALPGVRLVQGRPDIKAILQTEIDAARGAVSISVCGTTELAQNVRRALSGGVARFVDVLRRGPSVSLHVEDFE